jgi:hypothetical protein
VAGVTTGGSLPVASEAEAPVEAGVPSRRLRQQELLTDDEGVVYDLLAASHPLAGGGALVHPYALSAPGNPRLPACLPPVVFATPQLCAHAFHGSPTAPLQATTHLPSTSPALPPARPLFLQALSSQADAWHRAAC